MSTKQGAKAGMKTNVRILGCTMERHTEHRNTGTIYYKRRPVQLDGVPIGNEGGKEHEEK